MDILSDIEVRKLIMSFARSRRDKGFSEEDAQKIVDWEEKCRIDQTTLEMVLDDQILVDYNGTDIVFKKIEKNNDVD